MSLPIYHDNNKNFMLHQTQWSSQLNPVIQSTIVNGQLLKNIKLISGSNTINHLLSRMQQGWILADQDAAATIYRSQPLNNQTLTLTASAPVTISLWVF